MDKPIVSRHGEKRLRQRVGLPKKAVERNAQKALVDGIDHRNAPGDLRRYLAALYNRYDGNGNNIKVYNDKVYIFHDTVLITVLNLPPPYRKAAMGKQKNSRKHGGFK